jgi:hypothetical protein
VAGRLEDARRVAADAARTAAERHEAGYEANAFWVCGLIELQSGGGARESARRYLSDALSIALERGLRPLEAKVLLALGRLERNARMHEPAAQHLATARSLARGLSMSYWAARIDEELQLLNAPADRDV